MSRIRLTIIMPLALLAASTVLSLLDPSVVLGQDAITRLTIQQKEALVQHVRLADVVGPSNEFVEVVVGENGAFTIGTTGGDPDNPADDNQDLVYGHPGNGVGSDGGPSTSGTTVRVNGTDYSNFSGGAEDYITAGPTLQNDASIVEWTFEGVQVVQTLRIVSGTTSGRADAVQIRYDVTNTTATTATVGIRLMLDTMLGENDGAPFRIPGVGDVTREAEFAQANMPSFYQVFDDLANPAVQVEGTLLGASAVPPDRFVVADWGGIIGQVWDYTIDPAAEFYDSALGIWWNPVNIAPGGSRTVATYYGLAGLTTSIGDVALAITGPTQLTRTVVGALTPNPFDVVAFVQNPGTVTISNATAEIDLPEGLVLLTGTNSEQDLGTIGAGQQVQVSWKVRATDQVHGDLQYVVRAAGGNAGTTVVTRTIYIPDPIPGTTPDEGVLEIYWTEMFGESGGDGVLHSTKPDGSGTKDLATGDMPAGLTVDGVHQRLYWADVETGHIMTSKIDGSEMNILVADAGSPVDVAIDPAMRKIYWTAYGDGSIRRADMDGSNVEIIVDGAAVGKQFAPHEITARRPLEAAASREVAPAMHIYADPSGTLGEPWGIDLDLRDGKVYWTEQSANRVVRANLNGTDVEVVLDQGLYSPRGIKVDTKADLLFIVDSWNGIIWRADLQGGALSELIQCTECNPLDLEIDTENEQIYWSDNVLDQITRIRYDGRDSTALIAAPGQGVDGPFGLGLLKGSGMNLTINQVDLSNFPEIDAYITVTDANGTPIPGLTMNGCSVRENGVDLQGCTMTPVTVGGSAISVALVIDRSGSMSGRPFDDAKSAASAFVNAMSPNDRAAVISFSDWTNVDQDFTSDKSLLLAAIDGLYSSGGTALYDAVLTAVTQSDAQGGRKAIIAMTDGEDGNSSHTVDEAIQAAVAGGLPVYTVGLGSVQQTLLQRIADETGGRFYLAPSSAELQQVYQLISQQLQNQYLVHCTSIDPDPNGTERALVVTLQYQGRTAQNTRTFVSPTNIASEGDVGLPTTYSLGENYPDPFNPSTIFDFDLPTTEHVRLTVHDLLGRTVTVLIDEAVGPGRHEVRFDGDGLSSGIYLYRLEAGSFSAARRMVLVR